MKRAFLLKSALVGLVTSAIVTLILFVGREFAGLPFAPFDVFDWMARVLPGGLIVFTIGEMVKIINTLNLGPTASTAKLAEQSIAIVQFLVLGAVFGLVIALLSGKNQKRATIIGLIGAAILWVTAISVDSYLGFAPAGPIASFIWLGVVLLAWGWYLGNWIKLLGFEPQTEPAQPTSVERRRFLYILGAGGVGVMVLATGLVDFFRRAIPATAASPTQASPVAAAPAVAQPVTAAGALNSPGDAALAARILPAPGTRPEITVADNFYRIDINTIAPVVDANSWQLNIMGLVNKPLNLRLEDIRSRPSISQIVTMACISNPVAGDLIGTARWTGVPLKNILQEIGVKPGANFISIKSIDEFYETLSMTEAMDDRTMLVYEMDNAPLTADHGFPLRIYIPNHYGMKQPKWITSIELTNQDTSGYWVDRGWSKTAAPQTTSVIDTQNPVVDPKTQTVPLGGIAWAGARGIQKVEIQVDNNPWTPVTLRTPALSPLTWVQWRYDFPYKTGRYKFSVRATDGTGTLQNPQDMDVYPDGATGINSAVLLF
jgi:DMSO/TMAO reductase YedYZ molybdopterin-dependent catalytic subunit